MIRRASIAIFKQQTTNKKKFQTTNKKNYIYPFKMLCKGVHCNLYITYDHEGVKNTKRFQVCQSSFHMSNLKIWSPKEYEDKGPNMHNSNQFMASQNLLYNFF